MCEIQVQEHIKNSIIGGLNIMCDLLQTTQKDKPYSILILDLSLKY